MRARLGLASIGGAKEPLAAAVNTAVALEDLADCKAGVDLSLHSDGHTITQWATTRLLGLIKVAAGRQRVQRYKQKADTEDRLTC